MSKKSADRPVAMIYAHALYNAANGQGLLQQVSSEIESVHKLLLKTDKLEKFLVSPTISFADKRKVIEGAFANYSTIFRNFLLVLVHKQRAYLLGEVADAFAKFSADAAGMASVEVQSARPLETDERNRLVGLLTKKLNKRVLLAERVNPALLGGLVVREGDRVYDSSLTNRLKGLTEKLSDIRKSLKWKENGSTPI